MNKILLIPVSVLTLSFISLGFGDLSHDGAADKSFATQKGNHVTCQSVVNAFGFSNLTTPFKVGFYLSQDTTIETSDKLIRTFTVYPTQGGFNSYTCTINNVDLTPLGVTSGTFYVGAIVDVDNVVAENGMTPEIANNAWAYRNDQGVMKTVTYPGTDVGLDEVKTSAFFNVVRSSEMIVYSAHNGEKLKVELFSIDGKLLAREEGSYVTMPVKGELCIVKVESATHAYSARVLH